MGEADKSIFGLDRDVSIYMRCAFALLCLCTAGIMSGLTLSLFSLDKNFLKVLASSGASKDAKRAARLLRLLSYPHWVLVTLLVWNAVAVESLPLFLSPLVPAAAAVAIATLSVLIFGEVIPQSVFVHNALRIGATLSHLVWVLMVLSGIISYPLSKLLDIVVGHRESTFFRRAEMREFIRLQGDVVERFHAEGGQHHDKYSASESLVAPLTGSSDNSGGHFHHKQQHRHGEAAENDEEHLTNNEIRVMLGALSLAEKTVSTCRGGATIDHAFMLADDTVMDRAAIDSVFRNGFSRVPVHRSGDRQEVMGYLLVKKLLRLIYKKPEDAPLARECHLTSPIFIRESCHLNDLYTQFMAGGTQMAFSLDDDDVLIKLLTLEDVLETVHQVSFADETDLTSLHPAQVIMRDWQTKRGRYSQHNHFYHGPGGTRSLRVSQATMHAEHSKGIHHSFSDSAVAHAPHHHQPLSNDSGHQHLRAENSPLVRGGSSGPLRGALSPPGTGGNVPNGKGNPLSRQWSAPGYGATTHE